MPGLVEVQGYHICGILQFASLQNQHQEKRRRRRRRHKKLNAPIKYPSSLIPPAKYISEESHHQSISGKYMSNSEKESGIRKKKRKLTVEWFDDVQSAKQRFWKV
ncbi:unnamed protein product [Pseudo-nitzschia multistriata]|uniref:Uncharacterized protein n=1 Tax=Pseudo-nitzschia multistriata TaxID=183589 RepID=A0A448ZN64_9STRA|nr:unnamed protein product [Pseudo-nitzschia multistriata]